MSNVKKPEPFGYSRDGNLGGGLVFQHKISEMEALVCSTMPLYSPAQMETYAAERVREALKKAAGILDRMYVNALKAKQ